jgi:hypothetical protein
MDNIMKRAIRIAAVVFVCLSPFPAWAGERYLGTITSTGADTTNATTANPFNIPRGRKITIQCDAVAYVITDTTTVVSAATGIKLDVDEKFPTSTGTMVIDTSGTAAAGGAIVRVISASGTVNCKVFERTGSE